MNVPEKVMSDLVINFLTTDDIYILYTDGGMRLDVRKCCTHTLPIQDELRYPTHMWISAIQGFYVLRQIIENRKPGEWTVVREIQPEEPGRYFFEEFADDLEPYLADLEAKRPPDPPKD